MQKFFDDNMKNITMAVVGLLGVFLLVQTVVAVVDLGIRKDNVIHSNVISARGVGEAVAVPDIATFSFTVREEGKDVAAVQQAMTEKANKAIAYLKEQGIEDRDIKTENYYTNPRYEYSQGVCGPNFCPPSRQILAGYEVSQTVSVKVRDIAKAGDLLTQITALSISEVSSLSLTVDSEDSLKAEAKANAIMKAREDAENIAKALGVKLGDVVGIYEETPGYYGYGGELSEGPQMMKADVASAPNLQPGEQKFISTVSISYSIK
jgi:uncharacterized protein